ncbi:DUF262 domain-containing protein [Methanomicrobium antiquum]|uniref:DUF262 domain-containing protein n=1 Tax=Methanomicrobium antiquum TaxID=487686 RepID=A0AAF0FW68_9EURY|nr:DUF262 domain-containing protein [Methanomicrobium antiquum]WFN37448.1 DUF262 domain-containing protein [Methanomicrobium antiquum]
MDNISFLFYWDIIMNEDRTIFKKVDMDLSSLLTYIEIGDIGLPDIQRPFVWSASKVRDLFDSMYRGFPIGYLLFWNNPSRTDVRQIGTEGKQHKIPNLLIIDGQQRLTSLYSVFRGQPVKDENYQEKIIEIAFRPTDGKFSVSDAATKKDTEFIDDISKIWSDGKSSYTIVKDFLNKIKEKREISDEEEDKISHNLDRLFDLQKYPFTALEIASTVDEAQVADIFVRINSEGVKLNQSDFILTLLSVFGEDLRKELETFCYESRFPVKPGGKPSPYNHFITPSPDQLLRVSVALAFKRGKLQSVYQILRGKDHTTGKYSEEKRNEQFEKLRISQKSVLDLTNWHQFFSALQGAGFKSGNLISSENALLFAYAFYLIGKNQFKLAQYELDRLISRWFYTITLSGRYSSSPESMMDSDLNLIKDLQTEEEFKSVLENAINNTLTPDFWTISLPNELITSSVRNPVIYAFYASQIKQNSTALFSNKYISNLLDPSIKAKKKFMDRHHLFPKAYLMREGIEDFKLINQVANFSFVEWPDNIRISDTPPQEYLLKIKEEKKFTEEQWRLMHINHALPDNWENMEYTEFLERRRLLMTDIIKQGFESL